MNGQDIQAVRSELYQAAVNAHGDLWKLTYAVGDFVRHAKRAGIPFERILPALRQLLDESQLAVASPAWFSVVSDRCIRAATEEFFATTYDPTIGAMRGSTSAATRSYRR